jgi:hypothetical protein
MKAADRTEISSLTKDKDQQEKKFPNYSYDYVVRNLSGSDYYLYNAGIAASAMSCGTFLFSIFVGMYIGPASFNGVMTAVGGAASSIIPGGAGFLCHSNAVLGENKDAAKAFRGQEVCGFEYLDNPKGCDSIKINFIHEVAESALIQCNLPEDNTLFQAKAKAAALGSFMYFRGDFKELNVEEYGDLIGKIAKYLPNLANEYETLKGSDKGNFIQKVVNSAQIQCDVLYDDNTEFKAIAKAATIGFLMHTRRANVTELDVEECGRVIGNIAKFVQGLTNEDEIFKKSDGDKIRFIQEVVDSAKTCNLPEDDIQFQEKVKTVALGVLMHLGINNPTDIKNLDVEQYGKVLGNIAKYMQGTVTDGEAFNVYNSRHKLENQAVLERELTPEVLNSLSKPRCSFVDLIEAQRSDNNLYIQ